MARGFTLGWRVSAAWPEAPVAGAGQHAEAGGLRQDRGAADVAQVIGSLRVTGGSVGELANLGHLASRNHVGYG